MDELFERLCSILHDELERQETVQALCAAQLDAVHRNDVAEIQARSAAIQLLVRETVAAETQRQDVLIKLTAALRLPAGRQTLADLAKSSPEPWRSRLVFYQERLRSVMQETRVVVRDNTLALRRGLRFVSRCLHMFQQAVPDELQHYTANGREHAPERQPALINQQG